ncbi:dynamin family protein [Polaribacter litorisediminis]|uniref:dynamin family protein n=1 Tax=Polaribacter litorisediminis TaxID=1908341 RepID=UPI001CBE0908|nr:dynamin family protein [Polaribacter litorisediminis]UAM96698.1 dynamin family protein [Polaribacter litorisediminis]
MVKNNIFSELNDKITNLIDTTEVDSLYIDGIYRLKDELPKIVQAEKDLISQGKTMRIGIIGQVKSGKSSFLNALLFKGKDLLPKASTPMTAGLTVISYDKVPKFKVEYYSKDDWSIVENQARQYDAIYKEAKSSGQFEDERDIVEATKERAGDLICSSHELVQKCGVSAKRCIGKKPLEETLNSIDDLQGRLNQFVGAKGEFTSVTKTLYLYLPEEGLKGVEIVDTPGVNDPIVSREERTNEFLRSCHGVFLLSYTGQFCTNTDLTFLKERVYDQGISSVVVLGSKFDSGLIDIARTADGDLEYAIDYLSDSLKVGLKEAFEKKNLRNELPKLDCTSGLCYSLYHKPKNEWDENEAHIAKLLIKNYPDIGENREWFSLLGNIEEIKENYIEKDFKSNKELIITDRYKDFVENNRTKILNTISETKSDLVDYSKKINSLNSDNIVNQKNQRLNVEKFGKKSLNIINRSIKNLNAFPKKFSNKLTYDSFNHGTYLVPKKFKIEQYSGYWLKPNRNCSVSHEVVDSIKLKEILTKYLDSNLEKAFNKWSKYFSSKGPFVSSLKNTITDLLKTDDFNGIDPEIIQEVLLDSLTDIDRCADLFSKVKIKDFYNDRISRIKTSTRTWGGYFENKSDSPELIIDGLNASERDNYFNDVNKIIEEYKAEITKEISVQKEDIGRILIEMKRLFNENIGQKFEEVTAKYEQILKDKESRINDIDASISKLEEIEEIFN